MAYKKIILKKNKEASVKRYHPWIFSGAIQQNGTPPAEGELVEVFSSDGSYLATGHYHNSTIAVRILSFTREEIDEDFLRKKIYSALEVRKTLFSDNAKTNIFRLIHGEGDGLPGLIADYYNGVVVLQFHSYGMFLHRALISKILTCNKWFPVDTIYDKSSNTLNKKFGANDEFIFGNNEAERVVTENGIRFIANWVDGQKTGFFIDQRENRNLLRNFCQQKTVANIFGYTGGFSLYALYGGASHVTTVDSSEKALKTADENVKLNGFTPQQHQSICTDAFDFLTASTDHYDIVVIDPPAFAKHLKSVDNALIAYKRLNQKAIEKVRSGGFLLTFSCSQAVHVSQFRQAVFVACANTKRHARIIHQMIQPPDHPVSIYHPEGEYLKGLLLQIE